jgi:hypothetical protein
MRDQSFDRPDQRAQKCARHRFTLDAFGARTQALRADRRTLGSP